MIPLLSHPNEKIVNEVLAFLEIILVFGDRHVQEGLKELINSREFQIFPTLQKMLRRTSLVYNERYDSSENSHCTILINNSWLENISSYGKIS